MPSPPIQVFLTTIASQPALRQRQEYILRILQVKKIPFTSYDLASDEPAKKLWRRKAPLDKQQLPGILVGGRFPGTFTDFEEAVEYAELNKFLRLDEEWDEALDGGGRPNLPARPVGVPGASTPQQVTGHKPSYAATPSPLRKGVKEMDMGEELPGFGLQGLKVTDDEIADLVKDLGLEGDEANDLVKGLSSNVPDEKGGAETHVEVARAVEKKDEPVSTSGPAEQPAGDDVDKASQSVTEEKSGGTDNATQQTSGSGDDKEKQKEAFAESEIEKLNVQESAGDNA